MAKVLFLLFMVSEQENDFRYVRPKLEKNRSYTNLFKLGVRINIGFGCALSAAKVSKSSGESQSPTQRPSPLS